MKMKYIVVTLGSLWISQAVFSATDADSLHQELSRIRTFQAQFKQEVVTPQGKVKQRVSGEFLLQKPNRFVWQINQPHPQKLISNGKELWLYQPALKQAMRKPARGSLSKTPIEFLSGSSREISYYFQVDSMKKGNETAYRLRPKDKKMAFQEVQFVFQGNQLQQMKFVDPVGQKVKIQFYGVRVNPGIPAGAFRFVPPKGTDIIQGPGQKRPS